MPRRRGWSPCAVRRSANPAAAAPRAAAAALLRRNRQLRAHRGVREQEDRLHGHGRRAHARGLETPARQFIEQPFDLFADPGPELRSERYSRFAIRPLRVTTAAIASTASSSLKTSLDTVPSPAARGSPMLLSTPGRRSERVEHARERVRPLAARRERQYADHQQDRHHAGHRRPERREPQAHVLEGARHLRGHRLLLLRAAARHHAGLQAGHRRRHRTRRARTTPALNTSPR